MGSMSRVKSMRDRLLATRAPRRLCLPDGRSGHCDLLGHLSDLQNGVGRVSHIHSDVDVIEHRRTKTLFLGG